jgi:ABC-type nickel/cobalt efflux system permease component RcnA
MSETVAYFIVAGLLMLIVVIAPLVLSLRIRIFRWLHWNWLANWHERHSKPIIVSVRVIMGAVAVYLIVLGVRGL